MWMINRSMRPNLLPGPSRRGRRSTVVAALAALALALLPTTAANASGPDVLVSTDGAHFTAATASGVFANAGTIVPRGTVHSTLYVKNPTSHPAVLSINLTGISVPEADLARALSVRASTAAIPSSPAVNLATTKTCAQLLVGQALPAGQSVRVDFALAMADAIGLSAQASDAHFTLHVSLRDRTQPALASGCDASGLSVPAFDSTGPIASSLSHTGSDIYPALTLLSVLLGVGTYLLIAVRRRREES